uniref:BPTI/Kunitz inhibitor domain-containing protein n=1 Tax=Sphaeramia orbicularis TaxID=375764 RepID=A0A673BYR8_9TELE
MLVFFMLIGLKSSLTCSELVSSPVQVNAGSSTCIPTVLCRLPMKVGSCRAAFPRFFYNVTDQTCRRFTYGGCDANSNNFETKEECESTCTECNTAVIQSERCKAELQVGPCRAAFQRWYFNSLTGRCQRFIYGGCKGNKNNYENEESCRKVTWSPVCTGSIIKGVMFNVSSSAENCMVTSDPGPCRAAFPAFYYDHKTSTCRSFTYGGCRGNKNRYNTMEECTNRCSQGSERKRYGMRKRVKRKEQDPGLSPEEPHKDQNLRRTKNYKYDH